MFEFGKGSAYIIFYFHVDEKIVVVPFEVQVTVESSSPVNGALLLGFNGIIEMESVVF